jgi:hypothetical protein
MAHDALEAQARHSLDRDRAESRGGCLGRKGGDRRAAGWESSCAEYCEYAHPSLFLGDLIVARVAGFDFCPRPVPYLLPSLSSSPFTLTNGLVLCLLSSLIVFTSQTHVMAIPIKTTKTSPAAPVEVLTALLDAQSGAARLWRTRDLKSTLKVLNPFRRREAPEGHVSYVNAPIVVYLGVGRSQSLSLS